MPEVNARVELITPEQAKELLRDNVRNRNMSHARVEQYVGAMHRGEWTLNGETIKIADDGTLLDGQHRLQAVAVSGLPQQFVVVRGVEKPAQDTMDQGRARTFNDILNMRGVKFSSAVSLACRSTYAYQEVGAPVHHFLRVPPTVQQLLAVFEEHEDIQQSIYGGGSTNPILTVTVSWRTALHHLFTHTDPEAADTFFQQLREGSPRGDKDPIVLLRRRLERDAVSTYDKLGVTMRVALIIKAFNAFYKGERLSTLSWKPGANEEFPFIVGCDLHPLTREMVPA